MIKTIIWDWNGTLFDDVECCISSMNTLLKEYCLPRLRDIHDYQRKFCFPVSEYYKNVGFNLNKYNFSDLASKYMKIYQPESLCCALKPLSSKLLSQYKLAGINQIIISASKQENLIEQCQKFNISNYISHSIGLSDELAVSKIDLAKNYLNSHNIDPDEVIFIGDTLHDYEVAQSVGALCILVNDGHQNNLGLKKKNCYIVEDMSCISEQLMAIKNKSA